MIEPKTQPQEDAQYRKALRLSHAENPLPPEASKHYDGVNAAGLAAVRAAVFAAVGWFAGKWIGQVSTGLEASMTAEEVTHARFVQRNLSAAGAFVGGIMGAYGGVKDANHHARQVEELQQALRKQHKNAAELKQALQTVLTKDPTPKTQVLSQEAQHEAPHHAGANKAL